jgi:anti-sigma regulatory factor (Ser/Thr protein kinase)
MSVIGSVSDHSQIGEVRRRATGVARQIGLAEHVVGRVALVATEIATNLLKHGGGGVMVARTVAAAGGSGLELLGLDSGPGMADVGRCLADGFSTAGSPGTGLGAITRNADNYAIYSRPGRGTAVMACFFHIGATALPGPEFGVVVDPYPGESICGDGWTSAHDRASATLLVVDGSGHGPLAARAAETAIRAFDDNLDRDCVALVEAMHRALAPTRGAALAVARIDISAGVVRFVGVGNIAAVLAADGQVRRMASNNGTAGHVAPRIREFVYPFTGTPLVILHSDGLSARWEMGSYPGLAASHPALVAGVIFRDHRRGRDDAAVVAMRAAA